VYHISFDKENKLKYMFWNKKEKPKPMCFLIEEDLVALSAKDPYALEDIMDAISDTGGATVGNISIDPTDPDVQKVWVYPFPESTDFTVEEALAAFTKLGLHATLINEDA
jgi:hypothetical protein